MTFPSAKPYIGIGSGAATTIEKSLTVRHSMLRHFKPYMSTLLDATVRDATDHGRLIMESFKPKEPAGKLWTHDKVADGAIDVWLRDQRDQLAKWGQDIILIYSPEPESVDEHANFGLPGSARETVEAANAEVGAWEHILDIFDGVDNVRWLWCGTGYMVQYPWVRRYIPVDARITYLGADPYGWCPATGRETASFEEACAPLRDLGKDYKKPVMIPEIACWRNEQRPAWIREIPSVVANWGRLKGMCWFNNLVECDFTLNGDPASLTAWDEVMRSGAFATA